MTAKIAKNIAILAAINLCFEQKNSPKPLSSRNITCSNLTKKSYSIISTLL